MLGVLAFLAGFFKHFEYFPEQIDLKRCLVMAGFSENEIEEALSWLEPLKVAQPLETDAISKSRSIRVYSTIECKKMSVSIRGFIQFLEREGGITALQRETIINQLLSLPDQDITLHSAKLIGLMVLWPHKQALPALVRENLLSTIPIEQTLQ